MSWAKAAAALKQYRKQPIPKGWATVRMRARAQRVSYRAAQLQLDAYLSAGIAERKLIKNPAGCGSPCYIYRIKLK